MSYLTAQDGVDGMDRVASQLKDAIAEAYSARGTVRFWAGQFTDLGVQPADAARALRQLEASGYLVRRIRVFAPDGDTIYHGLASKAPSADRLRERHFLGPDVELLQRSYHEIHPVWRDGLGRSGKRKAQAG